MSLTFEVLGTPVLVVEEGTTYLFSPPYVNDIPPILPETKGLQRDVWRYGTAKPRGRSVLKENGSYVIVDSPDVHRINAAQEVYLGGHIYTVTSTVATALIAAGFTVYSNAADLRLYPDLDLYPETSLYPA